MASGSSCSHYLILEGIPINPRHSGRPGDKDNVRINHRIRAREVRVIGPDGAQLGIMDTRRALELAIQQGLDLAEISPTANPPVCKILNYGKFKYEQKKKAKEAKKNQVVIQLKEVQFRPQTDEHDIDFKVKHIQRFLQEGNKVKVSVRFRGREASHSELGHKLLKQVIDTVGPLGNVEQNPKMEGKILSLIFSPNLKAVKKPAAQPTEDSKKSAADAPKKPAAAGAQKVEG